MKFKLVLFSFLLFQSAKSQFGKYLPYRDGKFFGIMNTKTKELITPAIYDYVYTILDTCAVVSFKEKQGLIDYKNKRVLTEFKYDGFNHYNGFIQGAYYSNKSTAVTGHHGHNRYDYFNNEGKYVFTIDAGEAGFFDGTDTLTIGRSGYSTFVFSNTGRKLLQTNSKNFDTVLFRVKNNLIYFNLRGAQKAGIMNIAGKIIKPSGIDSSKDLYFTITRVASNLFLVSSRTDYKDGLVDSSANVVLPTEYNTSYHNLVWNEFENNRMMLIDKRNYCGYVDTFGRIVIPFIFKNAYPFSGNLAAFADSLTNKFGFIDTAGNIIIKPKFSSVDIFKNSHYSPEAFGFSEGLSLNVEQIYPGNFTLFDLSYIDTTGQTRIHLPNNIIWAGKFSAGLALVVNRQRKLGFIDRTGAIKIPFRYKISDEDFERIKFWKANGIAFIPGKNGYIDNSGFEYFKDK